MRRDILSLCYISLALIFTEAAHAGLVVSDLKVTTGEHQVIDQYDTAPVFSIDHVALGATMGPSFELSSKGATLNFTRIAPDDGVLDFHIACGCTVSLAQSAATPRSNANQLTSDVSGVTWWQGTSVTAR